MLNPIILSNLFPDTFANSITDLSKESKESSTNITNEVSAENVSKNHTKRKRSVKEKQLVFSATKKNFDGVKNKLRLKTKKALKRLNNKQIRNSPSSREDNSGADSERSTTHSIKKMKKKKLAVKSNTTRKNSPIRTNKLSNRVNAGTHAGNQALKTIYQLRFLAPSYSFSFAI